MAEGNAHADHLTMPIQTTLPIFFDQAHLSNSFFHQNAPSLIRSVNLTKDQVQMIISSCPDCKLQSIPSVQSETNPRGLNSLGIWQSDITHDQSFG